MYLAHDCRVFDKEGVALQNVDWRRGGGATESRDELGDRLRLGNHILALFFRLFRVARFAHALHT